MTVMSNEGTEEERLHRLIALNLIPANAKAEHLEYCKKRDERIRKMKGLRAMKTRRAKRGLLRNRTVGVN